MNYRTIVMLSMIYFLTGCTRNIMVNPENPDKHLVRINENGEKYSGTVLFNNGKLVSMKELWARGDSVYFKIKHSDENMKASMKDIQAIKFINRGVGAVQGLGLGILVGGISGFSIGLASGDDPPGILSFTAEEKGAIFGVALGLVGGFVGIIGGAASGSKENYVITHLEGSEGDQGYSRIILDKPNKSGNFYQPGDIVILRETEKEVKIK
jgi:hypothetical protein